MPNGSLLGSWYRTGTVSVVNGSKLITGVGTYWNSALITVAAGDVFTIDNHTWYEILVVDSDLTLHINREFEGPSATGINYAIIRSTSGTVASNVAGEVALLFNQKQQLLDEIRVWLSSSNPTENITDSYNNTHIVTTPNYMNAQHQQKITDLNVLMGQVIDNTAFHMWKAYADDANGSGISLNSVGKSYIGFAMNRTVSTVDITDPNIFDWALFKGADGVAVDGVSSYLHIAYADDANGGGFSQIATGKTFIGLYTDSNTSDSISFSDYSWSEIPKGVDGQGATVNNNGNGTYTVTGLNGSVVISDGKTPTVTENGDGTYTIDNGGGSPVIVKDGIDGTSPLKGAGQDYNDGNNGNYVSFVFIAVTTGSSIPTLTGGTYDGAIEIVPVGYSDNPVYEEGKTTYVAMRRYNHDINTGVWTGSAWSTPKIFAEKGDDGLQGIQGSQGDTGVSSYFHVAYADDAIGTGFSQIATGKLYIGTYVDYEVADALGDSDLWKWQLVKGSDGGDGVDGANGIAGVNGVDGQTSYLHIAYATNATGTTGFSVSDSVNKTYIGQYTDFTLADSIDNTKYSWTLIKGATGDTGATGVQGATGAAAPQKYSWTVFSDSKTAGAIYTANSPVRTYTGVRHNNLSQTPSGIHGDYNWYLSVDVLNLSDSTILAGVLDASKIDVGSVFAQTITATGTVTGGEFRTAATNAGQDVTITNQSGLTHYSSGDNTATFTLGVNNSINNTNSVASSGHSFFNGPAFQGRNNSTQATIHLQNYGAGVCLNAINTGGGSAAFASATTASYVFRAVNFSAGVAGSFQSTQIAAQFTSGAGHAPFTVSNTTKVANLNADMVDGYHALKDSYTANQVAVRNSSGDVHARLFRSNYGDQATMSGAIAFRSNTSDARIRFCSNRNSIRDWLSLGIGTRVRPIFTSLYYNAAGLTAGNISLSEAYTNFDYLVVTGSHDNDDYIETVMYPVAAVEQDISLSDFGDFILWSGVSGNFWRVSPDASRTLLYDIDENSIIHRIYGMNTELR